MKPGMKTAIAAAVAAGGLAVSATGASAYVACNGTGDCWRVHRHAEYNYRPAWGVVTHPDNWRWSRSEHYRWHDHPGRGYWRDGVWMRF